MISEFIHSFWKINIEFSLLLLLVLGLRWALKISAKIYNAYWLWLALPLTPAIAYLAVKLLPASNTNTFLQQLEPIVLTQSHMFHADATAAATDQPILQTLAVLWFVAMLLLIIRLARQHIALRRQLALPDFQQPNSLRSRFPVYGVSRESFSPSVYGFFKPAIYFPLALTQKLSPNQVRLIIEHEEQHVLQGHLWLNLIWDIVVCVFWFNPLVYFSRRAFRHDQEVLCDHLVIKRRDKTQQRAYGHALISTVSATHSVSLLCSWKMFDHLEERIMNIKTNYPRIKRASLLVSIIGVLSLGSLYAIANDNQDKHLPNEKTKHILKADGDSSPLGAFDANSIGIVNLNGVHGHNIIIRTDGTTFRAKNGERYVIEDGQQRTMTSEEDARFSELIERSKRYAELPPRDKGQAFDQEHVYSYTYDMDNHSDIEELEKKFEKLSVFKVPPPRPEDAPSPADVFAIGDIDIESFDMNDGAAIKIINKRSNAIDRIEHALKNTQATSDPKVKRARKQLETAQKRLTVSQKRLDQQREQALEKLEQLQRLSDKG